MKRPFVWTFLLISFGLLLMKLKVWGVLWGIEIFLILSPVVLLFLRKRGGINHKEWGKTVIVSTIVFMALLRGITWDMTYEQHRNIITDMTVAKEELRGTGKINQISENEYGYSIELNQTKIAINGKIQRCGKLYLYISKPRSGQKNLIEEYNLGDKVYVKGIPENFESARNEGNFHEAKYAYGVGRLCKLQDPELTLIKKGSMLCQLFENLEDSIRNVFARSLSAEDMGIGLAMITGNKDYLDEEDEERFYGVGIGHILAISGLHLSVVGMSVYWCLEKTTVPLKCRCFIALAVTFLFAWFSGLAVSALRALIMMGVTLGSYITGRRYDFFSSLGFAGTVLLCLEPWALFSMSFQYSFLAVAGVGMGQVFLKSTFEKINPLFQSVIISLFAWLFTLPVTGMNNFQVSWVGILLNVVVIPLMSPILILFFAGALLGMFFKGRFGGYILELIFGLIKGMLLLLRKICSFAEAIPGQKIIMGRPTLLKGILFIVLLVLMVHVAGTLKRRKYLWGLPFLTLWMCINPYISFNGEFVMLDVGQGDGIYIYDGKGNHFFVDGGSSSVTNVGKQRILPFLYSRRITGIDGWFVSHCDKDHVSGLLEILNSGFRVKRLFFYEGMVKNEYYTRLVELAEEKGTEIHFLKSGAMVQTSEIYFRCLNTETKEDVNLRSLVLEVCYKESKIKALLAGDIDIETEDSIEEKWDLEEIFIWKATHHGSKYSNGINILEEMTPNYCLISCSKNNIYGHPGKDALERMKEVGAELFYTMEGGQITIEISKGKMSVPKYIIHRTSCTFP